MKTLRSYSQQLLNIPDSTVNYSYHVVHDISSTSVQFSFSVMCDSLRPHGLQHARLPCPSPAPRACPNSCPLTQWCHPTTSSSVVPSPPTFSLSQHHGLFQWASSSHPVAKVLEFQLQYLSFQWIFRTDFFQGCLVWSSCSPRDSQESSPTPQFKSIQFFGAQLSSTYLIGNLWLWPLSFHMQVKSYSVCLSQSDLFHLA